ncbi:MAG: FAD-dependent oxidoreductase [Terrimicrobiaceae bacterium]|nr:FAD-dependent oxidoreductase [Terrimicrobiaceae bacterium]
MPSIAVIGAGLAGLSAAKILDEAGWRVVVFEKSRGFGGRCATKRLDGAVVDHGAQYFTMRDAAFRDAVHQACGDDVRRILAPVVSENGDELPDTGRFYHVAGNSRLARALGAGLDVRTGVRVEEIRDRMVHGETFDHILTTAPWPQTLTLAGREAENPYVPCLTAVLVFDGDPAGRAESTYAVSDRSGAPLLWSACENHKSGRIEPGRTVMVAQASSAFSREYLERDPAEWSAILQRLVEERWNLSAPREVLAHRWRFARIGHRVESPELPAGWTFAGDALSTSRVESAWLEGRMAAVQLLEAA